MPTAVTLVGLLQAAAKRTDVDRAACPAGIAQSNRESQIAKYREGVGMLSSLGTTEREVEVVGEVALTRDDFPFIKTVLVSPIKYNPSARIIADRGVSVS